jgi:FHA domain-containing protein
MLKNLLTKPVELKIDGKIITFKSMDDFEFAMGACTTIPHERIIEAINATPGELNLELNAMIVAIENISELINQSSEQGEVTQKLKAINSVIFSHDNNWRDIFFALKKDRSVESSKYKLIALTTYLQYLTNRQEILQSIKSRFENSKHQKDDAETAEFRTGELEIDNNFDSNVLAKELGMTSMPTAEYVAFELTTGNEIALLLANYKCKLILKDGGIKFVDNESVEYPMIIGLNKIGRGRECNVRFTDTMQRLSRLHLIIINHDNKKIELSDLSTYGTYYLKKSSYD